MYVRRCQAVP